MRVIIWGSTIYILSERANGRWNLADKNVSRGPMRRGASLFLMGSIMMPVDSL